jgi:glyoxylate carboligase
VAYPALVSVSLTLECWQFVDEARAWPTLIPLPVDVQAVLDVTPAVEISGPEPRLVVRMTRAQAEAVQRWLHALHDELKYDDARRLTCLMCIGRVAVAIMLRERQ